MNRKWLAKLAVLAAVALMVAPAAPATHEPPRTGKVAEGDPDFVAQFVAASTADADQKGYAFITYDPDEDNTGDEEYFLRLLADESTNDEVQVGDISLIDGHIVGTGDAELDYASSDLTEGAGDIPFLNVDFDDRDFWYLDIDGDGGVGRGDVRITAFNVDSVSYPAGSIVGLGDDDTTAPACGTCTAEDAGEADLSWFDADDNEEWSAGDSLVYQPGGHADTLSDVDDLRIVGGDGGFGTLVAPNDGDFIAQFVEYDSGDGSIVDTTDAAFDVLMYEGDDEATLDEQYFLRLLTAEDTADTRIQIGDLNLLTGELVASGDDALDFAASDVMSIGTLNIVQATFESDDVLWFLDVGTDGTASGTVNRGDVRLSPVTVDGETYDAGDRVLSNDNDLAAGYTTQTALVVGDASNLLWFDGDDNQVFSNADTIIVDEDNTINGLGLGEYRSLRLFGGSGGYGTFMLPGDNDFIPQFVDASDMEEAFGGVGGGLTVISYDPSSDVSGDEEYFLRLLEDADSGDALQVGDINLQDGHVLAAGDAELNYPQSDLTEGFVGTDADATTLDLVMGMFDDEAFWYLDVSGAGTVDRLDVRLTDITVDGVTYEAGTTVRASDDDASVLTGLAAVNIDRSDMSWFDADDNDEFSGADAVLYQPGGLSILAQLDDVRLFGQADADGDGIGDNADNDDDNDGVNDEDDAFPHDPSESSDCDHDGMGDNAEIDADNDGVNDDHDALPCDATETTDGDGDGIGDNADPDDDNDGVQDADDIFPFDATESSDNDGDGVGDNADTDDDNDGVDDADDALPNNPAESSDSDNDGIGDNADNDNDNDGVDDDHDAFPFDASESSDSDGDGIGDNADDDDDNDGQSDADETACGSHPLDPTSRAADHDGDRRPDCIDADDDNDGVADADDAFPFAASEHADQDGDGVGDNADAFPHDAAESKDSDGDGVGDNADERPQTPDDRDGDGVTDDMDAFRGNGTEWSDADGDGIGDNADPDDDNDGTPDDADAFPLDASESMDTDRDGVGDNADEFPDNRREQRDSDGDGIGDNADHFPKNRHEWKDSDRDGVGDNADEFPRDRSESRDSDGDGIGDNADAFPHDAKEHRDLDGDGIGDNADPDDDGDGEPDSTDAFPRDASESSDRDGDGIGDNRDAFPDDKHEFSDQDGDGIGDNADDDADNDGRKDADDAFPNDPTRQDDSDGDGIDDSVDNCPAHANLSQADLDGDGTGDLCDDDVDGDGHTGTTDASRGSSDRDAKDVPAPLPAPAIAALDVSGATITVRADVAALHEDVVAVLVWRHAEDWALVGNLDLETGAYLDAAITPNQTYQYRLSTVDRAGIGSARVADDVLHFDSLPASESVTVSVSERAPVSSAEGDGDAWIPAPAGWPLALALLAGAGLVNRGRVRRR